ncbi:hypothetical protein GCM10009839_54510 [Catenulispora yoronensis]|uniref:Carrier domain-containing protein n=1 Tax=Catenulispora yoronensis TaxID=450799 RepID=A0ABN2UV46_9ACTN
MPQDTRVQEIVGEAELADIRALWAEVLDREVVSDDTNFFEAGGDSLLLVALVELIRESSGVAVRTIDVLRAATVRGQAELVAAVRAGTWGT